MATRRQQPKPQVQEVIDLLRSHMPELRERYAVRNLWLFGSYVRGEQKKRSDLDVLVEFEACPLSLFGFVRFEHYLSELLGAKVDLVEKGALKPAIGRRILEEVVPI